MLDADPALAALETCGKAGVTCVTMLADGFGEAGAEGERRQERLIEIASRYSMTVIGPNSTGVVGTAGGFVCTTNAAFATDDLPRGRFAVLSQSGSVIGTMLSRGAAVGLGFHSYVSLGNEACIGLGEAGQMLVDDPAIEGFVLFMETLRRPQAFAKFAEVARSAGKPIIAYLVGRSEAGQHLAVSHTGAMSGGARALEAFLDAQGVIRVETLEVLAELSNALSVKPKLASRPKQATVVTTTGGGGGMVYDQIGLRGAALAPMGAAAQQHLAKDGYDIKPGALVDVTLAGTNYDTMKAVITRLIQDKDTGLVVAAIGSSAQFNPELAVKPIVDAVAEAGPEAAPVVAVPIPHAPESLNCSMPGAFRPSAPPRTRPKLWHHLSSQGRGQDAGSGRIAGRCGQTDRHFQTRYIERSKERRASVCAWPVRCAGVHRPFRQRSSFPASFRWALCAQGAVQRHRP